MKKMLMVLMVLMVFISLNIFGAHSKWYNEQKKTSKLPNYNEVVKELREEKGLKSMLEPNKNLNFGEMLAETKKCNMLLSG